MDSKQTWVGKVALAFCLGGVVVTVAVAMLGRITELIPATTSHRLSNY